jgi:hypothetical protein
VNSGKLFRVVLDSVNFKCSSVVVKCRDRIYLGCSNDCSDDLDKVQ